VNETELGDGPYRVDSDRCPRIERRGGMVDRFVDLVRRLRVRSVIGTLGPLNAVLLSQSPVELFDARAFDPAKDI
jgi:hypothetical protein